MISLIAHPNDSIQPRRLTPAELTNPHRVLGVDEVDVIYIDASIAMWVDANYLDKDRDEFNAAATFLARHYDYTFPSLRGSVLLCALRDDGSITNFTLKEAASMHNHIHTLANA